MIGVLYAHAAAYPRMELRDLIKLIYQNEFGGGHMIADPQRSLERLLRELAETPEAPMAQPFEPIGNGLVRAHLCAVRDAEALNAAFVQTANAHKGDRRVFIEKLDLLRGVYGDLPLRTHLPQADMNARIDDYIAQGCPMVSHTQTYHDLYRPAYRVIAEALYDGGTL